MNTMTYLDKTKEQIIFELLISLNNGSYGNFEERLKYTIIQYNQLVEAGIVIEYPSVPSDE